MLNLGFGEILIFSVLALVIVGPERLPTMVRFMGRQYGKLMRASRELRRAFYMEAERVESAERREKLKKQREEAIKKQQERIKEHQEKEGIPTQGVSQDIVHPTPSTEQPEEAEVESIPPEPTEPEPFIPFDNDEHDNEYVPFDHEPQESQNMTETPEDDQHG